MNSKDNKVKAFVHSSLCNVIFNPLTPMSDQHRISPYYTYTISCGQVMRMKKDINYGITD